MDNDPLADTGFHQRFGSRHQSISIDRVTNSDLGIDYVSGFELVHEQQIEMVQSGEYDLAIAIALFADNICGSDKAELRCAMQQLSGFGFEGGTSCDQPIEQQQITKME